MHRSFLGWRRVPYIGFGSMALFGGLAIMPFALILLTGETRLQLWAGHAAAALAFVLAGAGLQTTQTAGLALATDLAPEATRPRVVALLYVMLLLGMVGASLLFGVLLADYSHTRLVQVVQGTAVVCLLLNLVALWKQEPRTSRRTGSSPAPSGEGYLRALAALRGPAAHQAVPVGGGPGHRGVQHAGHHPRTLWRRDPAPGRRCNDPAHGADGRRRAAGLRARGARARPRR